MKKKWFEENWFRLAVIALAVFCVASVSFYFLRTAPEAANSKMISEKTTQCSQQRQGLEDYYRKSYVGNSASSYIQSSNHYDKKLDTCVVEITDDSAADQTSSCAQNTVRPSLSYVFNAYDKTMLLSSDVIYKCGTEDVISESYTDYSKSSPGIDLSKADFDKLDFSYNND